ncbi:MAG: hypothetical protein ACREHC_05595 [Candidatus Levyibacteriota bacterium]
MTIFYTNSYFGKKLYQEYYDLVLETLQYFADVTVISPELGNYQDQLDEHVKQTITDPQLLHYEAILAGIRKADAVIIEVTHEDLQIGYEAGLALKEKKPLLCLSLKDNFAKRIHDDHFFGAQYNKRTVKPVIQDFLAKVRERSLSKRFNLFLYPQQITYLEKAAKEHKMNVSEYIRRLINLDKKATERKS